MRRSLSVIAAGLALAMSSIPLARADVPPPNVAECEGKKAGDACTTTDQQAGTCRDESCSRLDYSKGTPPESVSYPCVRCAPGGEAAKSARSNGGGCAASSAGTSVTGAGSLVAVALLVASRRRRRSA